MKGVGAGKPEGMRRSVFVPAECSKTVVPSEDIGES